MHTLELKNTEQSHPEVVNVSRVRRLTTTKFSWSNFKHTVTFSMCELLSNTGLTSVWHEIKPVCFFFFCRSSHRRRTHPVCLTRLPFLSFQHYIWPPWMRCIIIYIRYRMSLNRLSLKSSLNLRLCVIIIMEVEANVRLTVHFWKCNFGMLWISPALQKRVFPKAASLSDFSGMILVWAAVRGNIQSGSQPSLLVPVVCFWLIPAWKTQRNHLNITSIQSIFLKTEK